MNIMVSREDCISAINKFIRTKSIEDAATLFEHACALKEINQPEAIKQVTNSSPLLAYAIPRIIDFLIAFLNLNKVTDKNNNLITVF